MDMEFVGSKYMGFLPYASGCEDCFAVREVIDYNKYKYPIFSLEGPDVEELSLRGSSHDDSTSWYDFHNTSISRRISDGQLYWNTREGLIPFSVGTFYPNGLLNKGYNLKTIDIIRAAKERHDEILKKCKKS